MINGLIFDFDGLILDTESPEYASWLEIYQEHGAHLEPEEWAACLGTYASAFDAVGLLEQRSGKQVDRVFITEEYERRALQKIHNQSVLPGVEEHLKGARDLGLSIAIASSSPRKWVAAHLERLNLSHYFSFLITRDDVNTVKPDPELYLRTLDCLGLSADQVIAYEDSPNGITAARKAGIFCVAIPNLVSSRLDLSHASLVIPSLADISLTNLIALASNSL